MSIKFEIRESGCLISCLEDGSYAVTRQGQIIWRGHNLQMARIAARTEGGAR